ncbi:SGNH/GDSL hydrolase family protein [Shewanella surugensis]|uniref:SGNH/GDSL hydrolase family protein n=1 Tax=Shewanella surugensis TaxID=212020 RepID=A0ABT0L7F0_9GAMM|nr:SGNH/GDSL hydrolase family protein [Shewanella surugensis]MCL1123622.1 SGNH/GDSL hydrolase family protein [Shewanella surugensis]
MNKMNITRKKHCLLLIILSSIFLISSCSDDDNDNNYKSDVFSNIIVFGDSQSDMGNYPQSLYYQYDPYSSSLNEIATNLYNPITQPIDSDIFAPIDLGSLQFPEVTDTYDTVALSVDTQSICTGRYIEKAVCNTRQSNSTGWLEYFAYNGVENDELFNEILLSSWVAYTNEDVDSIDMVSVDYAWYGALSPQTGCYNGNQAVLLIADECPKSDIYSVQADYRESQILENDKPPLSAADSYTLEATMPVPTLYQQVTQLFLPDVEKNPTQVNRDTLYIFYSGANDISNTFFDWVGGEISFDDFIDAIWTTIPDYMIGTHNASVETMIRGLNLQGQDRGNIFMFPQYNLGLTPDINYYLMQSGINLRPVELQAFAKVLGELVKIYNERLKLLTYKTASAYALIESDHYPKWHFYFLDNLYDNMNIVAYGDGYSRTFGSPCNDNEYVYDNGGVATGNVTPCLSRLSDPFLFWNTVHLASPGQQVIAQSALDWLKNGETILDTGALQSYTLEDLENAAKAVIAALYGYTTDIDDGEE